MFIENKYLNEANISDIGFYVTSDINEKEARIISIPQSGETQTWIFNSSTREYSEHIEDYWKARKFTKHYDNDIKSKEEKLSREIRNLNRAKKDRDEYDISKAERNIDTIKEEIETSKEEIEIERLFKNSRRLFSFVNNRGSIEVKVKMNNGDSFTFNICNWRTIQDIKDNVLIDVEKIEKTYKDDEVNIEYVYKKLTNSREKVMI